MSKQPNRASRILKLVPLLLISLAGGCATMQVRDSTSLVTVPAENIREPELLDISISIFSPVIDPVTESDIELVNLREAESNHATWQLASTLKDSGSWGSIRVNPFRSSHGDLIVSGRILQSDGQTLAIHIEARDARGAGWLAKTYALAIDYDSSRLLQAGPASGWFQPLYNQIANDLLRYKQDHLNARDIASIRAISQLKFAADFAPDTYQSYLQSSRDGLVNLNRLPPANDPMYSRIARIQQRNDTFLDAIQAQYAGFVASTDDHYDNFIRRSHSLTQIAKEAVADRKERRRKANRMPGAIVVEYEEGSPPVSFNGGSAAPGRRIDNAMPESVRSTALYAEALAQAGKFFDQDVEARTLEFDEHIVELSGTVEEQYQQWQAILKAMYELTE